MRLSEETERYIETIKSQLEGLGVLEPADVENLKFLAEQVELYRRALDELDRNGLTSIDNRGRSVANPAFSVARSCMTQITALMKELSISCRQRRLLTKDAMVSDETPLDLFVDQVNDLY